MIYNVSVMFSGNEEEYWELREAIEAAGGVVLTSTLNN